MSFLPSSGKSIATLELTLQTLQQDVESFIPDAEKPSHHLRQADLNGDGNIDALDFAILTQYWLETYNPSD